MTPLSLFLKKCIISVKKKKKKRIDNLSIFFLYDHDLDWTLCHQLFPENGQLVWHDVFQKPRKLKQHKRVIPFILLHEDCLHCCFVWGELKN